MSTRPLVITALAIVLGAATSSGAQAKSNNSHSGTTNHQASPGTGQAAKNTGQAQTKKKKVKPSVSDITVTKTKDQASPQ